MLEEVDPRLLWEAGAWGRAILLGFGVSIVSAFVATCFAFCSSLNARWLRFFCWLCGLAFAFGLLGSVLFSYRSGRAILLAMDAEDFQAQWGDAAERIESTSLTLGLSLGLVSLLSTFGISARAIRGRKASPKPAWFLPFSCALLCLTTAAAILMRGYIARNPYRGAALAVWDVVWVVEKSAHIVPNAKVVVVALAILSSLWVVVMQRRRKGLSAVLSRRCLVQSCLIGCLGFLAWLGSRPFARDGEHPLPFPSNAFGYYHCPTFLQTDPQALPRMEGSGKRCMDLFSEDIVPLALLDFGGRGPTADGRLLKSPADAFDYVNTKRLLRDAGNPPGHWSVLLIAAPASMPAEELGPWLRAVANPNQNVGVVLLHDQPSVQSATAGTIARGARCSCPRVVLDEKGASLRGYRWGDVASLAAKANEETPLMIDWREDSR